MWKKLVLIQISFVIFSFNTQAQERYFDKYPELNKNVTDFMEAFIGARFKEITDSQIRFDYIEADNGLKSTDLAYGQVQGTYTGVASLLDSKESANIVTDFRINLEKIAMRPKSKMSEFAIHLRADGTIDSTKNFMNFFVGLLTPECLEDNYQNEKSTLGDICRTLIDTKIDSKKSNVENAYKILSQWKIEFIKGLDKIKHPEFQLIKADFIAYISNGISITKDSKELILEINFGDLNNKFREVAYGFFQESKLTDYSLNSLVVQMNESDFSFGVHAVKYHLIDGIIGDGTSPSLTSVKGFLNYASKLSFLASSVTGQVFGDAFKAGRAEKIRQFIGGAKNHYGNDSKDKAKSTNLDDDELGL